MWVKFKWENDLYRIRLMILKKRFTFLKKEIYVLQIQQLNLDNDKWEDVYKYRFKSKYGYIKMYYNDNLSCVNMKIVSLNDFLEVVKYDDDEDFREFMMEVGRGIIKLKVKEIEENTRFRRRIGLL